MKNEHIVVDKTVCSSFKDAKYFKKLSEATIAEKYNIDEIETRILNGDGASWIKSTCQDQDIHFQLDSFHISQAIIRKVKDKRSQKQLIKLFRTGEVEEGLELLTQMLIDNNNDEKAFNKLMDLYDYLVQNRDSLIPYKLRDNIKLPTPSEGIEYKELGTMKDNICDVIAQRMKERKMSWSINGADNLAKILSEKFSNRLFDTVDKVYRNIISKEVMESINTTLPLTVFQANKAPKKCKVCKCSNAQIPYGGAAVTL